MAKRIYEKSNILLFYEDQSTLIIFLPNPVSETAVLRLQTVQHEALTATLYDPLGRRTALFKKITLQPGIHEIPLPLVALLPAGIYFIQLKNSDGAEVTLKLVKL